MAIQQAPQHQVVQHEVIVMHLTHPRHEWRKRTDDRHKTSYDNCLASILLIELMGLVEMVLLEYSGIGIIEEPSPEEMPYHVVARVAQYRGNKQYQKPHIDLERHVGQVRQIAPATKSRESPGKKGVTTNPVSQKITANNMA